MAQWILNAFQLKENKSSIESLPISACLRTEIDNSLKILKALANILTVLNNPLKRKFSLS